MVNGESERRPMRLERTGEDFWIDAAFVGELLSVPSSSVHPLMRQNAITSLCERGEGEHRGQYRLTLFYKGRRARLSVDQSGRIIRRSVVDFGDRPLPAAAHRSGGS
jgi:hypothetical protein